MRSELEIIKQPMNQLVDMIIHQHHLTRELIAKSQATISITITRKFKENTECARNSEASSLGTIKLS